MDIKDGLGYLNQTERELLHFDKNGADTEGFPLRFLKERIRRRFVEEIDSLVILGSSIDSCEVTADADENRYKLYEAVTLGQITVEALIDMESALPATDNPNQL